MSTKTLPNRPGGYDPIIAFLILSAVLHAVVAFGLFSFGPVSNLVINRILPKPKEPIVVDVVELPPGVPDKTVPKKPPTHFADRTRGVEKETYPEPSRTPPLRRVLPGSHSLKTEAGTKEKVKGAEKQAEKPQEKPAPITKEAVKKEAEKGPQDIGKEEDRVPIEKKKSGDALKEPSVPDKGVEKTAPPASEAAKESSKAKEAGKAAPSKPNLFPTEERIAELEKRYEAEAPKGEKGKTLQLNTSELRYQKYLMNMKHRIEFYWEYPEVAARNGWQGTLRIDFTINKDGTVENIKVVKSSNYPVLDDAAVTAIRLAAPFPPFPDNFVIEQLNIRGQFEYDIYRPAGR